MGLGEISLGEMGLGEMGLGEMGQNPFRWHLLCWLFDIDAVLTQKSILIYLAYPCSSLGRLH